jgi:hypothetical protein
MRPDELMAGLPGNPWVREGLADVQTGAATIPACLVQIARPRLIEAGLLSGETPALGVEPELALYRLLRREGGDAYSRYNALLRELMSFEAALDQRLSRRANDRASRSLA